MHIIIKCVYKLYDTVRIDSIKKKSYLTTNWEGGDGTIIGWIVAVV